MIHIHAETFIIIIIGPKMVFWPNFRQIGGYVFFRNWPFVHTHFFPFSAIFDYFRPVFGDNTSIHALIFILTVFGIDLVLTFSPLEENTKTSLETYFQTRPIQ